MSKDIIERLREFEAATTQSLAHEAAHEIESLRAQLAEALTAKDAYRHEAESFCEQLLASQAHAARIVEALEEALKALDAICDEMTVGERYTNAGQYLIDALPTSRAALSTPINLDALHEALARECERMANIVRTTAKFFTTPKLVIYVTPESKDEIAKHLEREASAHRAKKERK